MKVLPQDRVVSLENYCRFTYVPAHVICDMPATYLRVYILGLRAHPENLTAKEIAEVLEIEPGEVEGIQNFLQDIGWIPSMEPPLDAPPSSDPIQKRRQEFQKNRVALIFKIAARDGAQCAHCGEEDNLSIDHIRPISKGGSDDLDNLQILCRSCNSRKGDRQ